MTDRGFTLVEVLLAAAVASTMLASTVGLLAASARAVGESHLESKAIRLAGSEIETWRSVPTVPSQAAARTDGFTVLLEASLDVSAPFVTRLDVVVTHPRLRMPVRLHTRVEAGRP